ncbi:DUF6519 domain-containing protein [Nostoc sp. UHCC 0251]|uniref:DUF6519 domain-containing protein n=1 Tax=Nostoc sp. UHCC 0251 TaxID=3110240 RepID=UPI002B209057|nr:DUF6519 domain-containing protein [Nostoc sp. UHCC 0251]MEA5621528.1 DUF6519 domain-containing protein [Nostoc sp. UHCC 0251]
MQGEFRGDFTRNTYDKSKQFLRVLMQQGRVQLDADWNEQASILLDRLQSLAKDIIGLHGGSEDNCGFEFIANEEQINNLSGLSDEEKIKLKNRLRSQGYLIGKGNYYVEGILCENDDYIPFVEQPDFISKLRLDACEVEVEGGIYLAYLDVWERHITYIEDDNELKAGILEVALGGADTATRSKLVWQVKLKKISNEQNFETVGQQVKNDYNYFRNLFGNNFLKPGNGKLKARTIKPMAANSNNSCIIPFNSKYRGAENQLYRVEIFDVAYNGNSHNITFVWSRDNSSVVFPIIEFSSLDNSTLTLRIEHLGRDNRFSLSVGDWVEVVDDDYVLHELSRKLLKVDKIDSIENQITLIEDTDHNEKPSLLHHWNAIGLEQHPLLRRWDSRKICVELSDIKEQWIQLEDGVEVQFEEGFYQVGDYWLIPARTATGDVEWPKQRNGNKLIPVAQKPHGVAHYYAPLAVISVALNQVQVYDCRHYISTQKNSVAPIQESNSDIPDLNHVLNASWHHDQVFEISTPEEGASESPSEIQLFAIQSQDLTNLFTKLGLVIEFQKPVRVDSLHQRSLFISGQKINATGAIESYTLPIEIQAVQVKTKEKKAIRWLIGNEIVENQFNLITEVETLLNQDFTNAVRLILSENWSTKEIFTTNDFFQFTVTMHGDWILNEKTLFYITNPLLNDFDNSIIPVLCKEFIQQGITLSPNAFLFEEKPNFRWQLIDGEKKYILRRENNKVSINEFHSLDGNHIWPGVPNRSSGNGSEGGDWISVINIRQAQKLETQQPEVQPRRGKRQTS